MIFNTTHDNHSKYYIIKDICIYLVLTLARPVLHTYNV